MRSTRRQKPAKPVRFGPAPIRLLRVLAKHQGISEGLEDFLGSYSGDIPSRAGIKFSDGCLQLSVTFRPTAENATEHK